MHCCKVIITSNVDWLYWGPKQKLHSGWLHSAVTKTDVTFCDAFSLSTVVLPAFSALYVHLMFGHHPHPLGYVCAKFCFFHDLHCWGGPSRRIAYSAAHSLTQIIWCPRNRSFHFGIWIWNTFNAFGIVYQRSKVNFVVNYILYLKVNYI